MIGIPPLIGFFSKWFILLAFLETGHYFGAIIAILGSLTAVIYYLRYISHGYKLMKPGNKVEVTTPLMGKFYRESAVNFIVYTFTFMIFIAGVFYKVFNLPLTAAIDFILNSEKYIKLVLGG
jgi:multicomponent Na+:H+ antiporter subunit D